MNFHVIISIRKEDKDKEILFCYVGTPEEASKIGSDFQRKLDNEDRAKSKWTRKRVVSILTVEGQIGPELLQAMRIEKQEPERLTVIDAEFVDVNKDS